jgi:hypothetical protein
MQELSNRAFTRPARLSLLFVQARFGFVLLVLAMAVLLNLTSQGQDRPPDQPAAAAPAGTMPPVPKGVEVLARGPIHEAFATPTTEPIPTKPVPKEPPKAIDEMPPDQKPEGDVVWIGGYWAWDDERNDFLWVSGIWRTLPPGKRWVAGYWKQDGAQWNWVPGFWAAAENHELTSQQVNYLPKPPEPPQTAPPGEAPADDAFYVPGHWAFHDAGYVTLNGGTVWREAGYSWSPGYWARVQPGYVWVPAHYRWTPAGYIYVAGYWDLAVSRRGVLYAPVVFEAGVVGPTFVYTPAYAVPETVVLDFMFVRPCYCHYYFGDYYGPAYRGWGFESCIVYSRGHYDAIFVYERYEHRYEPRWEAARFELILARDQGRAPLPPRTLIQQNTIIQQNVTVNNVNVVNNNTTINRTVTNNQMLMPASQLAAAKGVRTVPLDASTRVQAQQQAQAIQQVALQRNQTEVPVPAGKPIQPRAATLNVPAPRPAGAPLTPAAAASSAARTAQPGGSARPGQPQTAGPQTQRGPTPGTPARPGTQTKGPLSPFGKMLPRPTPGQHKSDPPSKRPSDQKG